MLNHSALCGSLSFSLQVRTTFLLLILYVVSRNVNIYLARQSTESISNPKGIGVLSYDQSKVLRQYENNGLKTLVNNDYDHELNTSEMLE